MNPHLEQDDAWHDFRKRFLPLVAELCSPIFPDPDPVIGEGDPLAR
jgi:hypothetical protein